MKPRIEKLDVEHAPAVAACDARCMPGPWSLTSWRSEIEHGSCAGLFRGIQPAVLLGFIAWRQVIDEVEITRLAISPEYRRRGYARRLLEHVAAGRVCFLEVRASAEGAQAFYRACGFVETGRRVGYYGPPMPDDAIVLTRGLGE